MPEIPGSDVCMGRVLSCALWTGSFSNCSNVCEVAAGILVVGMQFAVQNTVMVLVVPKAFDRSVLSV